MTVADPGERCESCDDRVANRCQTGLDRVARLSPRAIGAVGSALPSHGRGHRFESGIAHIIHHRPGCTTLHCGDSLREIKTFRPGSPCPAGIAREAVSARERRAESLRSHAPADRAGGHRAHEDEDADRGSAGPHPLRQGELQREERGPQQDPADEVRGHDVPDPARNAAPNARGRRDPSARVASTRRGRSRPRRSSAR